MKLIQRYLQRQMFIPLILSLTALSLLALLTQSLSTLDLIVESRQSAYTFLKITLLALPQLFSIILPLAVFLGILYALNRMNVDSELVVTKASGFSPWQIASPALRVATIAMIVHLVINLFVQPLAFRKMRLEMHNIRTDVASRMVQAGEFNQPTPGLTVYASEILPSGRMKDVLIYDERSADDPITYMSDEGQLNSNDGRTSFTLINGNMHFIKEDGTMDITDFDKNTYDLTEVLAVDAVMRYKSSDQYLHELFNPPAIEYASTARIRELKAEGHSRLSSPLYNIALVLLALAFLIRGEHQKMGYGGRIAVAAAIGFGVRLAGFAIESAAEGNSALNIMQYLAPIIVAAVAIWYLLHKRRGGEIFRLPFIKRTAKS